MRETIRCTTPRGGGPAPSGPLAAASRASRAKVITGGQALCLLLTQVLTPVANSLFDDLANPGFVRDWRERFERQEDRSRRWVKRKPAGLAR